MRAATDMAGRLSDEGSGAHMRVLGVDPGLTRCGVGVVDGAPGRPLTLVAVDVVRTPPDDPLALRLLAICRRARGADRAAPPDAVAVERVFSQHNVRTVMGTAQVRAGDRRRGPRRLPVALHTPSEVKAAVTGSGRADKAQVDGHGDPAARTGRAPEPGRRRRRAGAGDLPGVARRRAGADRPRAGRCPRRHPHGRQVADDRRAFAGSVAAVAPDGAVIEVGGVGLVAVVRARPPWPGCGSARRPGWRPAWSCARTR